MKLNKLVLLPILLCSFLLASCHPDKQGSQPGFHSEKTSASYDTSIPGSLPVESIPMDNSNQRIAYSLTITGETYLLASEPHLPSTDMIPASYSYYPGDWVVFGVSKVMDADVVVRLNDEKLESHQESIECYYYQFYMPARDSVIDISIEGGI